jgi:hypothetical protein
MPLMAYEQPLLTIGPGRKARQGLGPRALIAGMNSAHLSPREQPVRASWRPVCMFLRCMRLRGKGSHGSGPKTLRSCPLSGRWLSTDALDAEAGVWEVTDVGPLA